MRLMPWACVTAVAVLTAAVWWRIPAPTEGLVVDHNEPAPIPAQQDTIDVVSALAAPSWPIPDGDSFLQLDVIFAAGADKALAGGMIDHHDPQLSHSALFATDDGGQHWRQIGPALPGHRVVGLFAQGDDDLWALLHQDRARPGPTTLLHSSDGGQRWLRHDLSIAPQGPVHMAFSGDGHGVMIDHHHDDGRRWFLTDDHGANWRLVQSHHAGLLSPSDNGHVTAADGWSWKLIDNRLYRRPPGGAWQAVPSQPADGYNQPLTPDLFAAR